MKLSELNYYLPEELIAQVPVENREHSRLMVIDRQKQTISHAHFQDLQNFIPKQCHIFRNNARVVQARLNGKRETGGAVECLLLSPGKSPEQYWCLLKPGKKLLPGHSFLLHDDIKATVLEKEFQGPSLVSFEKDGHAIPALEVADQYGRIPLPPYIDREDEKLDEFDKKRYQTVYADPDKKVAAAAPTAGLHFSKDLISQLSSNGAHFHNLTLHVGLGTFLPITEENVEDHPIHSEYYEIPADTVRKINSQESLPKIAVGTTTVRAIEHFLQSMTSNSQQNYAAINGWIADADIYIYPPYSFRGVDMLITNFHLPNSTLLCLVSAFIHQQQRDGLQWLKEIYAEAIDQKYRFYSYGDAMLVM